MSTNKEKGDSDKDGGELFFRKDFIWKDLFSRKDFVWKRLKDNEITISESICFKFTISKIKWIYFNLYRAEILNRFLSRYDSTTALGDLNIDI